MVPTPLIMLILLIAFVPSTFSYLFGWPKRRILNPYFAVMWSIGTLMVVAVALAVFDVHIVWLSWVLLALALLMVERSMTMLRRARAATREYDRKQTERRARGG
jgi:hypothetical protein